MTAKLKVIMYGIKVKLSRGEKLEKILESYTKLSDEEKQTIRDELGEVEQNGKIFNITSVVVGVGGGLLSFILVA